MHAEVFQIKLYDVQELLQNNLRKTGKVDGSVHEARLTRAGNCLNWVMDTKLYYSAFQCLKFSVIKSLACCCCCL